MADPAYAGAVPFRTMIEKVKQLGEEPDTYYTDQFNNTDAIQGYMGIGKELFEQVGPELAAFCGGVGTAGMVIGVSRALRARGAHDQNRGARTNIVSGAHHR
jgi:cysteine synthase